MKTKLESSFVNSSEIISGIFAKLGPNFSLSWAKMVFILNFSHHPTTQNSGVAQSSAKLWVQELLDGCLDLIKDYCDCAECYFNLCFFPFLSSSSAHFPTTIYKCQIVNIHPFYLIIHTCKSVSVRRPLGVIAHISSSMKFLTPIGL